MKRLLIMLACAVALAGCNKPAPAPEIAIPAQPVLAPSTPNEVAAPAAAPTPASTPVAPEIAVLSVKPKAARVKSPDQFTDDEYAFMQADVNDSRASCLRSIVDNKADSDVEFGSIRDAGDALGAGTPCFQFKMDVRAKIKEHSPLDPALTKELHDRAATLAKAAG